MRTWQQVPGWFDFDDIYDEAVVRAPREGAHFVELGVCFGRSAIYMGTAIRESGKRIAFDAVDGWEPDHVPAQPKLAELAASMGGVRETFEWYAAECGVRELIGVVQSRSLASPLLERYAPASLDLVFLDTSHRYEETRAEILAWLPKVRPGGVFAGHDFCPAYPGLVQAVTELVPGAVRRRSSFYWRVPSE